MKFGKYLASRQLDLPEYSGYFINYKGLKKLIKSLSAPARQANASHHEIERVLQENKATFFFKLERELEKINAFYIVKEAELKLRIDILNKTEEEALQKGRLESRNSVAYISIHEGYQRFRRDLEKLEKYIQLNETGFSKALKKWDKRSKSHTKEVYLTTAVEVQPVFHRSEISQLSDLASTCILELESRCDNENKSSKILFKDEDSDKITDELYYEFVKKASSPNIDSNLQNIKELIEKSKQTKDPKKQMTKILYLSISSNASNLSLQAMIDSGFVDLNSKDDLSGRNCLHVAVIANREPIIDIALKLGVDLNSRDATGRTPLHFAAIHNRKDVVIKLIEAGANLDIVDQDNFSPLLYSIKNKNPDLVKILVDHGASINGNCDQGYIPLNFACQYGVHEACDILLKKPDIKLQTDANGLSPIHVAASAGYHTIIQLLIEHNPNVNEIDKLNHWTALYYAALEGHLKSVKVLLEAGADPGITDNDGHSPDYYAAWEGHLDCLYLLTQTKKEHQQLQPKILTHNQNSSSNNYISNPTSSILTTTDLDSIELIPDLELPPPLIPLRRYGHNVLDEKIFLQLMFPPGTQAIKFYSDDGMTSSRGYRITVSSCGSDTMPRNISFPIDNDIERSKLTFKLDLDDLNKCVIDFELYPAFGTKLNAKATAISKTFIESTLDGVRGDCILPLFDGKLRAIAELKFMYIIVKPYPGKPLQISKYDTYWKSTTPNNNNNHSIINSNTISNALTTSLHSSSQVNPLLSAATLNSVQNFSFINGSSLSGEYVSVKLAMTRDNVPIICPDWFITNSSKDVNIPISDLIYSDFKTMLRDLINIEQINTSLKSVETATETEEILNRNMVYISLEDVLKVLPLKIQLNIYVLFPSTQEKNHLNLSSGVFSDINSYVDVILTTVFDAVRMTHESSPTHKSRQLIFSSNNADVCTVLNWKQPNFPVFYSMDSFHLDKFTGTNPICDGVIDGSLKAGVTFSAANNLLGIICSAKLLELVPDLIDTIRSFGLVLVISDEGNSNCKGFPRINGIRSSGMLTFKETIDV